MAHDARHRFTSASRFSFSKEQSHKKNQTKTSLRELDMSMPNRPTNQNDTTDMGLPMSAPSLLEHPALKPLHPYWRSFTPKAATVVLTGKNRTLEETTTETFAAEVLKKVFELDIALAGLGIAKKFILNAVPDLGLSEFRYHYENFLARATEH